MTAFDTALFAMFVGGILATIIAQWLHETLSRWEKEGRDPVTFCYPDIITFLAEDQSRFIQGDEVFLTEDGKRLLRVEHGWARTF